ncbi:class F sortase [Actinopolymorpha pittospori]
MRSYLRKVLRPHLGGRTATTLIVLAAITGIGLIFVDTLGQAAPPPMPTATTAPPVAAPRVEEPTAVPSRASAPVVPSPTPTPTTPQLLTSASKPVRVDIPAIDVAAPIYFVGDARDGTIDVPPSNRPYLAGWYNKSVTPGQQGRTVILGHLDSNYSGPAVFYYLGALKRGQKVTVTRQDGIVVVYQIDGTSMQPKNKFPVEQIYGPSDRSELRLITCGGTYAKGTGYSDNIIVYAHMVSWHRATPAEARRPVRLDTPDLSGG